MQPLIDLVTALSRRRNAHLAPDWHTAIEIDLSISDELAVERLCDLVGWEPPTYVRRRPKANAFPMLVFLPTSGWALAEQWQDETTIRTISSEGVTECVWDSNLVLAKIEFPRPAGDEQHNSAFGVFKHAIMKRKLMIIEATIATIVVNLLALVTSIYSMQVYDRVIPRSSFDTLWVLSAGMVIALVFDFILRNTRSTMVDREASEIDGEVSEYFFARMQSVRLDARPGGVGTIAAQLRGLEQVRSLMASASLFVLADLPFAILFIVMVWFIGGPVALVPIVTFVLAIVGAVIFSRLIRSDTAKAQISGNRKNGLLVESLAAAETVKANLGGWHMLAGWNGLVDSVHHYDERVRRWSTLAGSTFNFLQQVAYMGIVIVGAFEIADNRLTMGGLIACTIIGGRINGPLIAALPNFVVQWGYARSSLQALDAILALPRDNPHGRVPIRLPAVRNGIHVEGVQFEYPGARAGVSVPGLFIAKGEKVGVIGNIGSGKSTLIKLLANLYGPQRGHISIDGIEMSQVAENDLRQHIAYLPQDYKLLSGSIRDNLTLGIVNKTDENLLAAVSATGLEPLIRQHPMGLDLPITEGGLGLSGGQRALVGLTRTLMASPSFLFLDEATANLDQETEAKVLRELFTKHKDAAIIMVTHKPQLLGLFDRLIVMLNGQIVLDGKTAEVLDKLRPQPAGQTDQADQLPPSNGR